MGPSIVRFEAPDIVHIKAIGDLSLEAMDQLLAEITRLTAGRGAYFVLSDISLIGKISPEARKRVSERVDTLQIRGGVAFGASFPQRVIVTLLARVLSLFGNLGERPLVIVETEAQARAWIDARRRELASG